MSDQQSQAKPEPAGDPPRCFICGYDLLPDDVQIGAGRRAICARCWHREVGDTQRVPLALRREVEQAMGEGP